MNEEKDSLQTLPEFYEQFNAWMKDIENQQEEYWNSLTKDQQLMVFCAVVRRIKKGELDDKGSYRYILYQVFGFGEESYVQAQDAGYLELHNSILR